MNMLPQSLLLRLTVALLAFLALVSGGGQCASLDDPADSDGLEQPAAASSSLRAAARRGGQSTSPLRGLESNIANAKVHSSARDMATAAGHHHHHKHYPAGWLKMGAHTGKKGAFGWHSKHPVGGKGRR